MVAGGKRVKDDRKTNYIGQLLYPAQQRSYSLEASLPRLTEFVQMADLLLHKILAANCLLFSYDCTEKTSESRCFFFLISFISPEVKTNHL